MEFHLFTKKHESLHSLSHSQAHADSSLKTLRLSVAQNTLADLVPKPSLLFKSHTPTQTYLHTHTHTHVLPCTHTHKYTHTALHTHTPPCCRAIPSPPPTTHPVYPHLLPCTQTDTLEWEPPAALNYEVTMAFPRSQQPVLPGFKNEEGRGTVIQLYCLCVVKFAFWLVPAGIFIYPWNAHMKSMGVDMSTIHE